MGENRDDFFYVFKQAHRINVNSVCPSPPLTKPAQCTVCRSSNSPSSPRHIYQIYPLPRKIMIYRVSSLCLFYKNLLHLIKDDQLSISLVNQNFCIPLWKLSLFCVGFRVVIKVRPTWNTESCAMWIYTLCFFSSDWFSSSPLVPRDFFIVLWPIRFQNWRVISMTFGRVTHILFSFW